MIGTAAGVSILVLVDVSLKESKPDTGSAAILGFNPCFSGCISKSCHHRFPLWLLPVSILVLVDVSLKDGVAILPIYGVIEFQSLF